MRLAFWKDWDEYQKGAALKCLGLVVGVLCIFVFLSCISYLFSWKVDMAMSDQIANKAGSLGYKTGRLLICDLFGLGSLAIVVILAATSLKLLSMEKGHSLLKTVLVSIFGAFLSSLALGLVGKLAGIETAFGAGMGGRLGTFCVNWAVLQLGETVTGISIAVAILILVIISNPKVADKLFSPKEEKEIPEEDVIDIMDSPVEVTDDIPEDELFPETAETTEPEDVPMDIPMDIPEDIPGEDIPGIEIVSEPDLDTNVKKKLERIDNRLDPEYGLPDFKFPPLDLLENYNSAKKDVSMDELTRNNNKIRTALANYRIEIADVKAIVGPTVTLYKVYPAQGVTINQIKRLQEDIAMTLNARGVRVMKLSDCVGIEVANDFPSIVPVKALLNDDEYRNAKAALPIALGYTINSQKTKVFDLADAPHMLIAGATKQGKSVCLNEIVTSLLYAKHPSELKFVFVDPKMVEFNKYGRLIHHYLAMLPDYKSEEDEEKNAIVKQPKLAEKTLRALTLEMDERYKLLSSAEVNNLELYNDKFRNRHLLPKDGHRFMPYIVVIVDEYADLTMSAGASAEARNAAKSITNSVIRLAQKGRAAGIHVILATQRPSVDVISGQIKANFPARIAFRVAQRVDSMTILDAPGADKLIGKGDMLFSAGIETERVQCGLVEGDEIESITRFIGEQQGCGKCYNTPYYLPSVEENSEDGVGGGGSLEGGKFDERFEEAARVVVNLQKGSTSALQTKLGMGFSKASRVMDQLESAGIVGPSVSGGKPRDVLVGPEELESILESLR